MLVSPAAEAIAEAIAAHEPRVYPALPGRRNDQLAPVLLPLSRCENRWLLWVTQRSHGLSEHAGEICFPGGRPEVDDEDLRATALRETHEELGIEQAEVLGELSRIPLYTSEYRLVPFVAIVDGQIPHANPSEVFAVLQLDVTKELERESIAAIAFDIGTMSGLAPVFYPDKLGGGAQSAAMFGATAITAYELLAVLAPLYGVTPPPLRAGLDWETVNASLKED